MILPQFSCTARFEHSTQSLRQRRTRSASHLLVAKTCTFFWRILLSHCPNFAELELSKEVKSYHENPCNRITGKKSSPRSFRMPLCNLERKQKRPLTGEISPTRGQAKGRCPWKRNVPIHEECPHPRGTSPYKLSQKGFV